MMLQRKLEERCAGGDGCVVAVVRMIHCVMLRDGSSRVGREKREERSEKREARGAPADGRGVRVVVGVVVGSEPPFSSLSFFFSLFFLLFFRRRRGV